MGERKVKQKLHKRLKAAAVPVALGVALGLGFAATQVRPYLAQQRLQSLEWLSGASDSELRDTAHEALRLRFGEPHDAFVILMTHGDRTSIPILQEALTRQPIEEGGAIECTWSHAHQALERALRLPPVIQDKQ